MWVARDRTGTWQYNSRPVQNERDLWQSSDGRGHISVPDNWVPDLEVGECRELGWQDDAALLEQVKRMLAAINAVKPRTNYIDYIGYTADEKQLKVRFCGEPRLPADGRGNTLTEALKAALDAIGV